MFHSGKFLKPQETQNKDEFDMVRCCRAILILFTLGPMVGCGDLMQTEPGLYPVRIQSHSRFPALPDEKKWHFDVVLPRDTVPNDFFDLEVRRILQDGREQNAADSNSGENAEEIMKVTAMSFSEGERRVTISLQLLDLRDFSHDSSMANPMKLVGAIRCQGAIYPLLDSSSLVIGLPGGYAEMSNQKWVDGKVCLLEFFGQVGNGMYQYTVCLRRRK